MIIGWIVNFGEMQEIRGTIFIFILFYLFNGVYPLVKTMDIAK